ncbi:MAG TPA: WYL domain-containing protein [Nocardioides sp.]|nr:WYL domain-containing protein [Nocardioides sp.]
MNAPGRDQRAPMERLVRIAAVLRARPGGVSGDELCAIAGFHGEAAGDQLKRELRHLERQGWRIENVSEAGASGVYRMVAVDNRLRVKMTPEQQRALRRAALLADRADLAERLGLPDTGSAEAGAAAAPAISREVDERGVLSDVVTAVRDHRVLRFGYKGAPRVVHPDSLRAQNGTWYLRGVEEADLAAGGPVKAFVVSRMSAVELDARGSAQALPAVRHPGLHPMSWEIDPPVEVVLRTTPDYEGDVMRWLGDPVAVRPEGEAVLLTYRVTNREALRARLYELARRVEVVGPEEVRRELVDALAAAAGHEGGAR